MLRGRPLLGLGLASALIGAAWLSGQSLDSSRQERVGQEAERTARYAVDRARDVVGVQMETVTLMAHNGVVNPRLGVALRGRVDDQTLNDIFDHEPWWEPYRKLGTAVSYDGGQIDFIRGEGMERLPLSAIVRRVRQDGTPVSNFFVGGDLVFALAAVPMRFQDADAVVLVLARPLDKPTLTGLQDQVKAPLLLTDGKRPLGSVGAPGDTRLLQAAIGREREGRFFLPDTAWGAAVVQVGPQIWMWAGGRVTAFARAETGKDKTRKRGLWAGAIALAALVLGLSLRSKQQEDDGDEEDDDSAPDQAQASAQPIPAAMMGNPGSAPHGGVGTPLGRYVLLDRIGEGGMAEIFTAVSFGSGGFRRSFVVKRLRPEMATNPVAVAHFIDEANLASTLVHPNIVPVFDFGEVAGSYFLAQEYIVGRDLGRLTRRMVERNIPAISPQAALYIAHEMLRGLHYAHEKRQDDGAVLDLVHRDVTPENAMISERGEVKILDFGIVKAAARVSQTDIGMVKGNVDYMSPEQARGRSVDRRSDVFSTGLVLCFAMTRTPLYRGETLFDRLTRAAMGPGEEELAQIAALPKPLPEILKRALAIDPAERYQTAAEFAQAVAPYISGGAGELTGVINALYGDELQLEQDRLAAAFPRVRTRESSLAAAEASMHGSTPDRDKNS
jgi:Protein kinase domain